MPPRAKTEEVVAAPVATAVDAGSKPEAPTPVVAAAKVPLDLNDDIARIRQMRERQPFGAFDQKMALSPIEGYKLHWFNDNPGRVETALSAGWTHINDHEGHPKSLIVDSGGLKAYAMKIPEQFWAEDQARQNKKAADALAAVKKKPGGNPGQVQASDQGAFYTPNPSGDAGTISRS